jgi:diaminohydroxyphosphoribosylaminopyrimidine deaminase/5-amino-6-(5-phosphoribosylamino)uracil reductase
MQRDDAFMRRALSLAKRGRGRTSPNPAVGAVVVADGQVVGEGYHHKAGEPHAEILALRAAGNQAPGATMYVTLEPCCHHGRTPPCTDAIIAAGIRRLVYGGKDPNPAVSGKGHAQLEKAGLDVLGGVLEAQCSALNEAYNTFITTGRPLVVLKAAASLDGKIATASGQSRWITGEKARRWVHRLRSQVDAILVGVGTVRADNPRLNARIPGGRDPLRIVLDGLGQIPVTARCLEGGHCLVVGSPRYPLGTENAVRAHGAKVMKLPADPNGDVSLQALLDELGRRQITSLLVEGGAQVHAQFIAQGLAHKLYLFLAPIIIGGATAPGWVGDPGIHHLDQAPRLDYLTIRRMGPDRLLTAYFTQQPSPAPGLESKEETLCSPES